MSAHLVTSAVASLAVDLGASFRPQIVLQLSERLESMHRDQVAKLEGLAGRIGIAPPDQTEAMAWANTLELVLRCVQVGTENQEGAI